MDIKLPRRNKPIVNSYTDKEVELLLKCLDEEDIKHRTAIHVALACGLRRGELMGLEWKDIDFENETISILRASQHIKDQGTRETGLKTETSRRTIAIPHQLADLMRRYKEWQDEEKLKAEDLWHDSDRLFVNDFGEPLNPDSMYQWFERFLKRHSLKKITMHGLRHTNISMLIANGENIVEVSKRAGHSDVGTTMNIYAHSFKEVNRSSANIISKVMYG
ncbi:MAG: site-specific integrase [Clostridia bacterium]